MLCSKEVFSTITFFLWRYFRAFLFVYFSGNDTCLDWLCKINLSYAYFSLNYYGYVEKLCLSFSKGLLPSFLTSEDTLEWETLWSKARRWLKLSLLSRISFETVEESRSIWALLTPSDWLESSQLYLLVSSMHWVASFSITIRCDLVSKEKTARFKIRKRFI